MSTAKVRKELKDDYLENQLVEFMHSYKAASADLTRNFRENNKQRLLQKHSTGVLRW